MSATVEPLTAPNPATTDWVPIGPAPPVMAGVPTARVWCSAALSIPHATWTVVSFDSVRWDTGAPALHWSASNPTRLTCRVAGTYAISGSVGYVSQGGGNHRIAQISLNGSVNNGLVTGGAWGATIPAGPYPYASPAAVVHLNVGDFIELWCYQDSGSALAINPGSPTSTMGAELAMALVGGPKGDTGLGVPVPVVNGQWIKGVGGAAVWAPIQHGDILDGITTIGGNQFRTQWSSAHGLEFVIDDTYVSTQISGAMNWLQTQNVGTGRVAHNTDFAWQWAHNLGKVPDAISLRIEDIWYARNFSWATQEGNLNGITFIFSAVGSQGDGNAEGTAHISLGFRNP